MLFPLSTRKGKGKKEKRNDKAPIGNDGEDEDEEEVRAPHEPHVQKERKREEGLAKRPARKRLILRDEGRERVPQGKEKSRKKEWGPKKKKASKEEK